MGIRQEFESLRLHIKADRTILESAVSREATVPLSFIERHYPTRLGAILTATTSYLLDRLVSGNSPEEIATRSRVLIKTFSKPVSKPV